MTSSQPNYGWIAHPIARTLAALAVALLVFHFLPVPDRYREIRLLSAYDAGMVVLLGIMTIRMWKATPEQTYLWSQKQEPSNRRLLSLAVLFTAACLVVIALMLDNSKKWPHLATNLHMVLSLIAILLAWLLVHCYFAIHYARMYYDEADAEREKEAAPAKYKGGLQFPGRALVDYWDFLYYSFTIAMCFQTSDVTVSGETIRRVTLIHSILSFFFVTSVIGLIVNVVSNLV